MKQLFRIAFQSKKYYLLFFGTLVSLLLLTVASQMEMCAFGVMANKGPGFFELFDKGSSTDGVPLEHVMERLQEIDADSKGAVSRVDVSKYLSGQDNESVVSRIVSFLDAKFNTQSNLNALAGVLIFVALFKAFSMFMQRFFVRMVAIKVSQDLRQRYFEHLQTLPMSFFQKYDIGTLSSRVVTDALMIAESLNAFLLNFMEIPFRFITTAALCWFTSPKLSMVVFVGCPLIIFPVLYLAKHIKRIVKKLQRNQESFASVLIDFLGGVQTVKMFGMEKLSLAKYTNQNEVMAGLEKRVARYDVSSRPIIHTIGMLFLGVTLLYGLYGLHMEIGELFLFCGLLYLFYEPIKKFSEQNSQILRGIAAAERMDEVLQVESDGANEVACEDLQEFSDEIVFEDVWFSYEEQPVLKGVSFRVKKGQTVAIVGPTGSGKSTIVQLLPKLYPIDSGSIKIDGKKITDITASSLRRQMAFVPQRPFLFLDSVAANIEFGSGANEEQVRMAAKKAEAAEFIEKLPEGYDSVLAEAGKNLSGGQQQRLAIARALVKQAPILVMDEATSALDNVSESKIKKALHALKGQITQIVIAHRLSTIAEADHIVYLRDGVVLAQGTRDELLSSCPDFQRMWELQDQAALAEV